jgi:hypothetical protein
MQIWAQIGLKHKIRKTLELVTSEEEVNIYSEQDSGPSGWDTIDERRCRPSADGQEIFQETSLENILRLF